jgi:hypothetical protein
MKPSISERHPTQAHENIADEAESRGDEDVIQGY